MAGLCEGGGGVVKVESAEGIALPIPPRAAGVALRPCSASTRRSIPILAAAAAARYRVAHRCTIYIVELRKLLQE